MKRIVSGLVGTLLFIGMLTLAFNIQPVKASGTIYIRADGSIDPPTAPIQRVENTYTLADNIMSDANGVLIERDNIVLDGSGYTLRGPGDVGYPGGSNGTYLIGRTNITITNLHIINFFTGIMLDESSNCTLLNNIIENVTGYGIWLASSHNNSVVKNRLTGSGIYFYPSSNDNRIVENDVANAYNCILLFGHRTLIHNNTIANSSYGISLAYYSANNNTLSNNAFSNAGLQIHYCYGSVVENNTVNGKPLVYLEKASDHVVQDAGQVILVNCNNIRVNNLNLSHTSYPIQLLGTNNSIITNNSISASNWNGIQLLSSSNNTLEGNNVTGNLDHGIYFHYSSYNTLRNNVLSTDLYGNQRHLFISGWDLSHFTHEIDDSNTANGQPIYYWINKTETTVPQDAGYVALVNCTRITVQNLNLTNNAQAVLLAFTTNSTITQNVFSTNKYDVYMYESHNNSITKNDMVKDWYGVLLHKSSGNLVQENTILQTNYYGVYVHLSSQNRIVKNTIAAWYGVYLKSASDNLIYHNDFGGTWFRKFRTHDSVNIWDDGYPSGGNYWGDYNGTDMYSGPYQNETGSDGIGDTPYIIDSDNQDNFPLMNPWTPIETSSRVKGKDYPVTIVSNTTIEQIVATSNTLRFKSSGPAGDTGYILVVFPMANTTKIKVFIDGGPPLTPPPFPVINSNGTHYFIYFEFTLSTHAIAIQFAPVAPPVGGVWIPVDKLQLVVPWLTVALLTMTSMMLFVYFKHRKKEQS